MPRVDDDLKVAARVSPLCTLVRSMLERVLSVERLDDVFADVISDSRQRTLTAGTITHLMLQVVSGTHQSVFSAFQADQAEDQPLIATTYQALYERLGRLFPDYSSALVRASAACFHKYTQRRIVTGNSWKRFSIRMIDGTQPEGSEHRLGVLRACGPAGLPAQLVMSFDPDRSLCVDAEAAEDAYASESSLAAKLFSRATAGELYVADRAYSSSSLFGVLVDRQADFVIREISSLAVCNASRLRKVGHLDGGRVLEQQVIVTQPKTGRELTLRRIVFRLASPTQKGEPEIRLLTTLGQEFSAVKIAELYGHRWSIETQINRVKHILQGEIVSLGKPRAAIFVLCLAMVASNAIAAAESLIREHHEEGNDLSGYYLADEIAAHYRSISRLVSPDGWQSVKSMTDRAFSAWLSYLAKQIRPVAFRKHPRGPKKPPRKRSSGKNRHHFSTHRLIQQAKQKP